MLFGTRSRTGIFQGKFLEEQIARQSKILTIGVMGTGACVGTTHSAILLATYFAKRRSSVTLCEWHGQNAFRRIRKAYEGCDDETSEERFKMRRIHYEANVGEERLGHIRQEATGIIILDFGRFTVEKARTMGSLDKQYLVAQGIEWKMEDVDLALDSLSPESYKRWELVIPLGDGEEAKHMQRRYHKKATAIGFIKDPFSWSKELDDVAQQILGI